MIIHTSGNVCHYRTDHGIHFHFILVCLVSHKHSSAYWLWLSLYPLFFQLCFIIVLCLHPLLFFFSNTTDKCPILNFFLLREIRGSYENRRWKWGSPLKEHPDRNKIYSYLLLAKCLDSYKGVVFCWVTYFVFFGSLICQDTIWQEKQSSWYPSFSRLQGRCQLGDKSSMNIIESMIGRIETSCLSKSGFLQIISLIC